MAQVQRFGGRPSPCVDVEGLSLPLAVAQGEITRDYEKHNNCLSI